MNIGCDNVNFNKLIPELSASKIDGDNMKIIIVFIGMLTILAGVLPFFNGFGVVPFSGPIYLGSIIFIGVIAFLYAVKTFGLWGSQKFITAMLALLIIFGGLIPFLVTMSLIPSTVPSSGPVYSGIIILIGIIAVLYGAKQL